MTDDQNQTAKERLLRSWDELDRASSATWSAQAWQMSAAIERLEAARLSMRAAIMEWGCSNAG